MAFPNDLGETYTTPNGTDKLNNPSHTARHQAEATEIQALKEKVGIDSSADTDSHDYKLSILDSHLHTGSDGTEKIKAENLDVTTGNVPTDSVGTDSVEDDAIINRHIADNAIETAKIKDAQVTPAKRTGGFKIGLISPTTLNSTGDKAVTSLGFTPKMIQFFTLRGAAGEAVSGMGIADGSTQWTQSSNRIGGGGATENCYSSPSHCISGVFSSTTPDLLASLKTLDADGFTVTVATATNRYTIGWIALG